MSLAKEINKKLDEILAHQEELKRVEEDYNDPNFELKTNLPFSTSRMIWEHLTFFDILIILFFDC